MGSYRPSFAGLLPHPPIVVPEVGGERLAECRATFDACTRFGKRFVASGAERLLLISPHSPRQGRAFGIWTGPRLIGDLSRFGAPEATVDLENDRELGNRLRAELTRRGLESWDIPVGDLDHGAVVPLTFLVRAGFDRPTTIISLPMLSEDQDLITFGRAVATVLDDPSDPCGLIASGDMTHGASPDAPAGLRPRGVEFDHTLRDLIAAGRLAEIAEIDILLRDEAAEDASESSLIVAAALDFRAHGAEVLSYEHPFGVGYLVAVFDDGLGDEDAYAGLPGLAREAIRARLEGREPALPRANRALAARAPLFVTLKWSDGVLRGCMGAVQPLCSDLVAETVDRAHAAAFEDPRFPPVGAEELDALKIDISVLQPAEVVTDPDQLDPAVYGLILSDDSGRRAVLLPGIEGIDSVDQQIAITRQKAGIRADEPVTMRRFRVVRVAESERS